MHRLHKHVSARSCPESDNLLSALLPFRKALTVPFSSPQMCCRFKKGGRGWQNPLKAGKTSGGAADELKTPDQASTDLHTAGLIFLASSAFLVLFLTHELNGLCCCRSASRSNRRTGSGSSCNNARARLGSTQGPKGRGSRLLPARMKGQ